MHFKRSVTVVVTSTVLGFAAFGILAASAATSSFTPVVNVNSLSTLPASGGLLGTTCVSSSYCVAVGEDGNSKPFALAGDPSTWSASQAKEIKLGSAFDLDSNGSLLSSVACTSSTSCVAVGSDGNYQPLALVGNPSTWSASQATQITLGNAFGSGGSLSSVSCVSASSCVAVGYDMNGDNGSTPFVLVGDPSTWSAAQAEEFPTGSTFGYAGGFTSVSCTSTTSCVAVGWDGNEEPLVLAGNPSTWGGAQMQEIVLGNTLGNAGSLSSVACTSSSSCVAVGSDGNGQPLVLAGDPSTWGAAQAQEITLGSAFGDTGYLRSIACTSSTFCVAAGGDGNGNDGAGQLVVLAGNPSTWSAAQAQEFALGSTFGSGLGNFAVALACASSTSCLVVGTDGNTQPLAVAGDPATWSAAQAQEITLRGAEFGAYGSTYAVTCLSATACFKLGEGQVPYLLKGNPAKWDQAAPTTLNGVASGNGGLAGAACTSPTHCVAVGEGFSGAAGEPFVLNGDPSTWGTAQGKEVTLGSTFDKHGYGSGLGAVACASATYCVAIGVDGNYRPFVLAGNPSTWSANQAKEITLGKAFGHGGWLSSIACPSSSYCVAVGQDERFRPLVLAGNPHTWGTNQAREITLGSSFGTYGSLSSVACTSSTYCVGVGQSGSSGLVTQKAKPLVLRGNPSTWRASKALNLGVSAAAHTTVGGYSTRAGRGSGSLTSISCRSATYCLVVGGDKHEAPVYIAGNPKKWTGMSSLAHPAHTKLFTKATITGAYCTRTACFAGGYSNGGDFVATIK